ncbi:MAG: FHA domain-containing protein [Verrucomicrobiales bacterium]|nr:FHA domain-containing protein [Verrucomicrobiales bacterium]HQZ27646.1 FHA domain-containing protein [Verrucomicrobiales bacterium]
MISRERIDIDATFWTMADMSQNAFSLIVCLPGEAPVRHDLTDATASLGRSPENSIQMLVAEVSVKHGSLVPTANSFHLVDGGSTNGTKVNGVVVGAEGIELTPMAKILFGTVVHAYFVPTAILDSTPMDELIASLNAAAPGAQPKTAPIAIAQAVPLPVGTPAAGAATVKLDQVRTPGPGPVAPAKLPAPGGPLRAPGAPPAALPPRAPGAPPAAAPRAPGPPQPGKLPIAPPAGGAPTPVPLKKPVPGAPPSIPLPKLPPKPGQ